MVAISAKHPKIGVLTSRAKAIGMQFNTKWIHGYRYIVFNCSLEQEHKINNYLRVQQLNKRS